MKTETAESEIFRELLDSSMVPTPESLDAVIPSKVDQCSIFYEVSGFRFLVLSFKLRLQ